MIAALHPLWRSLPAGLRRVVYERVTEAAAAPALATRDVPAAPEPPWVVAGFLRAPTGLGEAARLAAQALAATGEPVSIIDLTCDFLQAPAVPAPALSAAGPGRGTLLLFVQPPNVARAISRIGRERLAGKRRIGCWVWDLETVPSAWARQRPFVHEIAAPSAFAAQAFARAFAAPVRALLHPLALRPRPPGRAPAGGVTRFGAALDLASTAARKNPRGVVAAYRAAFAAGDPVTLALKLRDERAEPAAAAEIRRAAAGPGAPITIAAGDFDAAALDAWWSGVDVLVSLHRSEGFGLVVAEAMLRGLPVVSTDWSATAEYVDAAVGWPVPARLVGVEDATGRYALPCARWAEPSFEDAVAALRAAARDPAERARRGEAARERIERLFSPAMFLRQLTAPVSGSQSACRT